MVEVNLEARVRHVLYEFREESEKAVDRNGLIVEGRQHQYTGRPDPQGMCGQLNRIRQRTRPISHQQPGRADSGIDYRLKEMFALRKRKRVCFGRGSKNHEPVAPMAQEPIAVSDRSPEIDLGGEKPR